MHALVVHNRYKDPGGEDQVFSSEVALLGSRGVSTRILTEDNRTVESTSRLKLAAEAVWRRKTYHAMRSALREHPADVVHFHNTFPLISPSAYYAARHQGAAVVQTLHNYRLLCPGANFSRNGSVCEQCVESRSFFPAVKHGCYRASRAATAAVAALVSIHKALGTWRDMVDIYIALSEFARSKFIAGGFPAARIAVKPNFVDPDPGPGPGEGAYALFAGRLSEEKGVAVLAQAWKTLPGIPLLIAGDGPLARREWPAGIVPLGPVPRERVFSLMQQARVVIVPSVCYENAPMTIAESFACACPVIASDLGSLPEFVTHGRTGLLFRPGDPEDLAATVRRAWNTTLSPMRPAARREFEQKYTAAKNYQQLMAIYTRAVERRNPEGTPNPS